MQTSKISLVLSKELEKRALPDLFVSQNCETVTTVEEWEKTLRPYWLQQMLTHEYGKIPPYVKPEISSSLNIISFAGKAKWETVTFT